MKDQHLVLQQPSVNHQTEKETVEASSDLHDHEMEDCEIADSDPDPDSEAPTQEFSPEGYTRLRDEYGNFLCRLEAMHHVPQRAVGLIASEVLKISSQVLSHTVEQVGTSLGRKQNDLSTDRN